MELKNRVIIITGGSGGIGKAMAKAFLSEGASKIVLADLNEEVLNQVANEVGADAQVCDVTKEEEVQSLVDTVLKQYNRIDLFCSNAGALSASVGVLTDAHNESWQAQWDLNVMAHLYAARAVLPSMLARKEGYLLNTASAAGLLAAMESGPYTVTKAAAVKLAEFLSITHADDGIKVSVLCPQGVNTAMAPRTLGSGQTDGILEPHELAETVVTAIKDERFHVLPHPEVENYVRRKGDDIDRWLAGMRRLRRSYS